MLRLLVMAQPLGLVSLAWRSLPSWTELDKTGSLASPDPRLPDELLGHGKLTRLFSVLLGFAHRLLQLPEGVLLVAQQRAHLLHPGHRTTEMWSRRPAKE